MLKFIKENKMFSAVVAVGVILLMTLCYGFAVRNEIAVVIGSFLLFGAIAYSLLSLAIDKELARK